MTVSTKPNRAYPALPAVGGDAAAHTLVLKAMKEAIEIHERRTGNKLDSFVRLRELIDLRLLALEGEQIVLGDGAGSGTGGTDTDDQTAAEVPYNNATSGLAANDVQAALDEIVTLLVTDTDDQTAAEVPYDNTSSGLTADDVQEAIDELVTLLGPSDIGTEILADNPTAYWPCNDASSPANDASVSGANDLSGSNTPTFQYGYLLKNSTDMFLRVNTNQSVRRTGFSGVTEPLTGDYTIEMCFMIQDLSANLTRLLIYQTAGGANAFALALTNSGTIGRIQLLWNAVTNDTGIVPNEGTPYHLVLVKDGTANTVTTFLNGRKISVISYGSEPTAIGGTIVLSIGESADGGDTSPFVVGHVAFYNGSKLSELRIMEHAKAAGLAW